ncbi:MAG: patatin-like phospholipase family protein [Verrucomicrobia bacterium]|nr:patatin-like phospholipase family protein [Verrucomicrobiota bacterium]
MGKKALLLSLAVAVYVLFTGFKPTYEMSSGTPGEVPAFELKTPVRIALVLGGGGSKGLAHLGAIQELEAAGIRPDLIVGCSAGSIVGALYADDPALQGVEKTLLSLTRSHLLDLTFLKSRFGWVEGKALQSFMSKNLRSKTFDELKIPLIVIATDLYSGDAVELSHKEISTAVGASCAYPGIFKPVFLYERYLIDGGASNPIPVEVARKYGAEIVIAIDVSEKLPSVMPYHFFGIAKRGVDIMYRRLVEQSLTQADISIRMEFQNVGMFSDHLNHQMYQQGRLKVRRLLPQIKKLCSRMPEES